MKEKNAAVAPTSSAGGYYSETSTFDWYESGYRYRSLEDLDASMSPLIRQLEKYDRNRLLFETKGGDLFTFSNITGILREGFTMSIDGYEYKVSLADRESLRRCLSRLGYFDLYLDVRQLGHGMPVYYLCRAYNEYYSEYNLIIEDLYISPGYPIGDERFVKLMHAGHDVFFLRLSPFRPGIARMLGVKIDTSRTEIDRVLMALRATFLAAWHDHQRPGVLTAQHFGLPHFKQAIELLYLCLSGELCELRNAIDKNSLDFFKEVYPQPAIRAFLKHLNKMEGSDFNDITETAKRLYARLIQAFVVFINTEVTWGSRALRIPLKKIIFGNFFRLEMVSKSLAKTPEIVKAAETLETISKAIAQEIVKFEGERGPLTGPDQRI